MAAFLARLAFLPTLWATGTPTNEIRACAHCAQHTGRKEREPAMSHDEILQQVRSTPVEALPEFIGVLARAQAEAHTRLLAPAPAAVRQHDQLLSADAAAARLGISKTTLYHRNFPFTVRDSTTRRLRFSANGIEAWIAKQTIK